MLKIDIQNPKAVFVTPQEDLIRALLGLNILGSIDVNAEQTVATWMPFNTSSDLSCNGSGLKASGISLTGGHIDSFTSFDTALAEVFAVFNFFNRNATFVQSQIDQANAMRSANGWTFGREVHYLQKVLFGFRPVEVDGSVGQDFITGSRKADLLNGHGGQDIFFATRGDDTIHGGAGDNDRIDYTDLSALGGLTCDLAEGTAAIGNFHQVVAGVESLDMTSKGDDVSGDDNPNILFGLGGADTISGGGGNDTIYGGDGRDNLFGDGGDDQIFGDGANDLIEGNAGNDDLFGDNGMDTIYGNTGNDFISGGNGPDILRGGADNDHILGGRDNDNITGNGGDDRINGDAGMDTLLGGGGRDFIAGGANPDTIMGGAQADRLFGNGGGDSIEGGLGKDQINGGFGNDTLYGEQGNDTLGGGRGEDTLGGGLGNDSLTGGPDSDTFEFYNGLNGGNGNDTIADMAFGDKIVIFDQYMSDVQISAGFGGALVTFDTGTIILQSIDPAALHLTETVPADNPDSVDLQIDLLV